MLPVTSPTNTVKLTARCWSNLLSELLSNLLVIMGNHRYSILYLIRTNYIARTADVWLKQNKIIIIMMRVSL